MTASRHLAVVVPEPPPREPHPAAALFPLMADGDYRALVADVAENGLRVPILLDADGQVVDGRNRYRACEEAGVEPRFATIPPDADPLAVVVSLNQIRRHLTAAQRAMIAAEAMDLLPSGHGGPRQEGNSSPLGSRAFRVAKVFDVSSKSVQRAVAIRREHPETARTIKEGKLPLSKGWSATREARTIKERRKLAERMERAFARRAPVESNGRGHPQASEQKRKREREKRAWADAIRAAGIVNRLVAELPQTLPKRVNRRVVRDAAKDLRAAADVLEATVNQAEQARRPRRRSTSARSPSDALRDRRDSLRQRLAAGDLSDEERTLCAEEIQYINGELDDGRDGGDA